MRRNDKVVDKDQMKEIGENLIQYRKRKGYTQKDVLHKTNISQPTLSGYEQGEVDMPLQALLKLSKLYKTTPNDICGIKPKNWRKKSISVQQIQDLKKHTNNLIHTIQYIEKKNTIKEDTDEDTIDN